MPDSNNNGILDSHEKWWLLMRITVLVWSLGFLSASYLGLAKDVDRPLLATLATASAGSFIKRPK